LVAGVEKLELVKGGAEAVAVVVGGQSALEGGGAGFGAGRWSVARGWR
jgi:hypothetical protein